MSQTHRRPTFSADAYAPQGWRRFSHDELDSMSRQAIEVGLALDGLEPVARAVVLTAFRGELERMKLRARVRDGAHRAEADA